MIKMNTFKVPIITIFKRSISTPAKKIDYYYDVISPYSWFAFEVLLRYKNHWNIDLELQPALLGGILKETGNAAPLTVSLKADYLHDDVVRCGKYFDVPVLPMKDPRVLLSTGSLSPMRFLTACKIHLPAYLEDASRAFWMIRWNKDEDFTKAEALKEVCKMCKMSEEESKLILERIKSEEVKSTLAKVCKNAVELNVFGVPSTIFNKDGKQVMIFGSDRFPIIAQELEEEWKGPNPDKI